MTKDGEPICVADLIRRATVRQLRLHACGCMRLNLPKRKPRREVLRLIEVAERYADGEVGVAALRAAYADRSKYRMPKKWAGDSEWAFTDDSGLQRVWDGAVAANRTYYPAEKDYRFALPRYRVFEELIGPDPLPAFAPEWRTDTAVSLARGMYESRDFSAMPILADALQDAGCDNADILNHCRDANQPHVRGCWVVDLVLGKQ